MATLSLILYLGLHELVVENRGSYVGQILACLDAGLGVGFALGCICKNLEQEVVHKVESIEHVDVAEMVCVVEPVPPEVFLEYIDYYDIALLGVIFLTIGFVGGKFVVYIKKNICNRGDVVIKGFIFAPGLEHVYLCNISETAGTIIGGLVIVTGFYMGWRMASGCVWKTMFSEEMVFVMKEGTCKDDLSVMVNRDLVGDFVGEALADIPLALCVMVLGVVCVVAYKERRHSKEKMRLLTPNLSIYAAQDTNMLSIGQRLTGVLLLLISAGMGLMLKNSEVWSSHYISYEVLYNLLKEDTLVINSIWSVGIGYVFYHVIIGVRHIYWERSGSWNQYRGRIEGGNGRGRDITVKLLGALPPVTLPVTLSPLGGEYSPYPDEPGRFILCLAFSIGFVVGWTIMGRPEQEKIIEAKLESGEGELDLFHIVSEDLTQTWCSTSMLLAFFGVVLVLFCFVCFKNKKYLKEKVIKIKEVSSEVKHSAIKEGLLVILVSAAATYL
jgi:succinate dehydrogenase/fumarate reductase cytochrome b subunit